METFFLPFYVRSLHEGFFGAQFLKGLHIKKKVRAFPVPQPGCNYQTLPVPEFIDPVLGVKMIVFTETSPKCLFRSNPYPKTQVSACFG